MFKIGGSLARARALPLWLRGLAVAGGGRAVIVPGGGPFADTVREMHTAWRFPDPAAHEMALLAMEQYGLMMSAIEPKLVPVCGREEILEVLSAGRVPVWLPRQMSGAVEVLPRAWELSSDSLAAWLSGVLGAEHLGLVKSVSPSNGLCTAADLARRGIVDRAFPKFQEGLRCRSWWLARRHHRHIRELLMGGAVGSRIVPAAAVCTPST